MYLKYLTYFYNKSKYAISVIKLLKNWNNWNKGLFTGDKWLNYADFFCSTFILKSGTKLEQDPQKLEHLDFQYRLMYNMYKHTVGGVSYG